MVPKKQTSVLNSVYTHNKILHVSAIYVAIFRDVKQKKSWDILEAQKEIKK